MKDIGRDVFLANFNKSKKPRRRNIRGCESVKREVSVILMNLRDPRIDWRFVSVVRVWLSKDSSACKVFISSLNGKDNSKKAVNLLNRASGFIKSKLVNRLKMRVVPSLQFVLTDSIECTFNIRNILNRVDL